MGHDVKALAEQGYNAYGEEAGWKTFDGRPMPTWSQVGEPVQARWIAAARRIAQQVGAKVG